MVRLPDLGRNQKMMFLLCYLHMLYAKDEYAFRHDGYISGDAERQESTTLEVGQGSN